MWERDYGRRMARFSDDDFAQLQQEVDRDTAAPLGGLRRAAGGRQNESISAWLGAGDTLAEKAIAALDTGDEDRALALARRIVALPEVDDGVRAGLMAVSLALYNELVDPAFEDAAATGLLDAPLRLLPELDPTTATELRRVLAAMTDYDLPDALLRRIRSVVPADQARDAPFTGVAEEDLPDAVVGVLRLMLRLRSVED